MTSIHNARAIVARPPGGEGNRDWNLEQVTPRTLAASELLVRMVATGICHTDLISGTKLVAQGGTYPRILGHEGSGIVEKIGSAVIVAKPGDKVLLSFAFCQACTECEKGHPAYCKSFAVANYAGGYKYYTSKDDEDIQAAFLGQSSFSSLAITAESSVVNVSTIVKDEAELKLFCPLGCGFQTGAGTVIKRCQATPGDVVVVMGLGGVGMAAIMAAKIVGCTSILGIDIVKGRLDLALELGASHVIDTSDSTKDVVAEIQRLTDGEGPSITLDTTGNLDLIKKAYGFTGRRGRMVIVGVPAITAHLDVHLVAMMATGKILMASIEGDVTPHEFVPQMIKWHREGRFPINKLVEYFKVDDFEEALTKMKSGEVIKPVLVW